MDDVKREDIGESAHPDRVGRVNLPVEPPVFGEPVEPQTIDARVEAQTIDEPAASGQSRWNWGASDLLLGLVAILVMIVAAVIILQGVFQIMPA